MFKLPTILAFLAAANAFTVPSVTRSNFLSTRTVAGPSSTAKFILLTEEETEFIMTKATDCADGECDIDSVNGLIGDLTDQQGLLEDRLKQVVNMIEALKQLNEKDQRETDEVRQYVRDLLRVFSNDKPMFNPSGFSGDIGDGPTTAYDALPPKKFKADKK